MERASRSRSSALGQRSEARTHSMELSRFLWVWLSRNEQKPLLGWRMCQDSLCLHRGGVSFPKVPGVSYSGEKTQQVSGWERFAGGGVWVVGCLCLLAEYYGGEKFPQLRERQFCRVMLPWLHGGNQSWFVQSFTGASLEKRVLHLWVWECK